MRPKPAIPVVLLGGTCLSWLGLVYEGLIHPTTVVIEDAALLGFIQACTPLGCPVHLGVNSVPMLTPPSIPTSVLLIDGGWKAVYQELCQQWSLSTVIFTKGIRRRPSGWAACSQSVSHAGVGGVTNANCILSCFTRHLPPVRLETPSVPLRDVSTVLEDAPCGTEVTPPIAEVEPLRVLCLEDHQRVIHGRGLVPWPLAPDLEVVTPSLFASADRWVRRRLTLKERLGILDLPLGLLAASRSITHRQLGQFLPLGCLRPALRWVTGGVVVLDHEEDVGGRRCIAAPLAPFKTEGASTIFSPAGASIFSKTEVPMEAQCLPVAPGTFSGVSKRDATEETGSVATAYERKPPADTESSKREDSEEEVDEWLRMAAEKRELTATKSDDAKPPIELWRQQMIKYYP